MSVFLSGVLSCLKLSGKNHELDDFLTCDHSNDNAIGDKPDFFRGMCVCTHVHVCASVFAFACMYVHTTAYFLQLNIKCNTFQLSP
jgi:hypothetical protein